MTNEEYIKSMPQCKLAQFLCNITSNCKTCEIREKCGKEYPCGFYDWLEETYNGRDITEDFYTFKNAISPINHGVGDVSLPLGKTITAE